MSGRNGTPPILPPGEVLPPMTATAAAPRRDRKGAKAKGPAGRFAAVNTFADFTLAGLDRAQVAVWLLLWRDTKPDGLARTAQADLARRAGVSTRTVERAVRRLAAAGLVQVVRRGGLRRGPSVYRVHPLANLETIAKETKHEHNPTPVTG